MQQGDINFQNERVGGLAEVSTSMQASLTANSKTLKGMDSFVGRICGVRSPRSRGNVDRSPRSGVKKFNQPSNPSNPASIK